MLRNTLNYSEELESTAVKRCHRSYMVNLNILQRFGQTKKVLVSKLDVDRLEIFLSLKHKTTK